MPSGNPPADARHNGVFRIVFSLALASALVATSLWVLEPFTPAVIWATMIVVSTWSGLLALQRLCGGRRGLAVAGMVTLLVLVVALPVSLAITSIVEHVDQLSAFAKSFDTLKLGEPPAWLHDVPLAGEQLVSEWRRLAADPELGKKLGPYAGAAARWTAARVGGAGAMLVQVLLTIVLAGILYAKGELAGRGVLRLAHRIAPEAGESSVRLAAQAIRGVALGVVVTAIAQSLVGWVGLALAGVPGAAMLTMLMFVMAVAQLGATPVLACAALWKFTQHDTGWGVALVVWAVVVGTMDNVIRPILIRKGVDLPLLLIFAGVVGGLLAFGIVGLFIGPVVLAVTWTLMKSWVAEAPAEQPVPAAADDADTHLGP